MNNYLPRHIVESGDHGPRGMAEHPGPSLPVDSGASVSDTELESGESGDPGIESIM